MFSFTGKSVIILLRVKILKHCRNNDHNVSVKVNETAVFPALLVIFSVC